MNDWHCFQEIKRHKRPALFLMHLHWCAQFFWKQWEQSDNTAFKGLKWHKRPPLNLMYLHWCCLPLLKAMVIIRRNWLRTNKTDQATKYDGGIGWQRTRQVKQSNMTVGLVDNEQDKPNSLVDDKRVWFVLMGHQESLVDNKRVCLPWWNNFFVSLMLGTTEPDEKDIWIGWCGRCFKGCHHDWNPFNQGRQTTWAIKAPSQATAAL